MVRDSGGIRTPDPQLRRLLLYPAELLNPAPAYGRTKKSLQNYCFFFNYASKKRFFYNLILAF